MKILGIDTSTAIGSIGLIDEGEIIAEQTLSISRQHASRLIPAIDQTLKSAELKIRDIDAVAVAIGPGSFTGVRIAVSTAKTICYAIERPVIGISTLESIAYNLAYIPSEICVILDARKDEVYSAVFKNGVRQSNDRCLTISAILSEITPHAIFVGNGLRQHAAEIKSHFKLDLADSICLADSTFGLSRGTNVARLGLNKLANSNGDNPFDIIPNYIRAGVSPPKLPIKK